MRLIRAHLAELTPWGRFWFGLGIITLAAAAGMSFDFGWTISAKHALFLMCMTAVAAFLPEAAYAQWIANRRGSAAALALLCVPLLGIEFYTHAGYTAGLRGSNIETARVQNTRYDAAQEAVTDDRTNLGMWRDQLSKLQSAHAWVATVKAEGLRAQLDSAQKAIDLETARGGCKTKCLALMKDKGALEERIAIAEKQADLTGRIEATQRLLDGKRDKAAVVEHKSSAVAHQNEFLAKAVALASGSLRPTEMTSEGASQVVNLAMALAGTGLPALALFVAGLYRRRSETPEITGTGNAPRYTQPFNAQQASVPPVPVSVQPLRVEVIAPQPPPRVVVAGADAVGPMVAVAEQRDVYAQLARLHHSEIAEWCARHGISMDAVRQRALQLQGAA